MSDHNGAAAPFPFPPHDCSQHPEPKCHHRPPERGCETCYEDVVGVLDSIPGMSEVLQQLNTVRSAGTLTFHQWFMHGPEIHVPEQ